MKRTEVLRLAMTPGEIAAADALAFRYGMSLPEFARAVLAHAQKEPPELTLRVEPRRPGRPAKRHVVPNGNPVPQNSNGKVRTEV